MTYDFDTMPERHGMDSIAVDWIGRPDAPAGPKEGFSAIPMWVADMNHLPRHYRCDHPPRAASALRVFPGLGSLVCFHPPLAAGAKRRGRSVPAAHRV